MSTTTEYRHITVSQDGIPRIGRTRYKVLHLAGEHYHLGWSAEDLLRQHPDLKPEEVYAALTYFYDHYTQMAQEMSQGRPEVEARRSAQTL